MKWARKVGREGGNVPAKDPNRPINNLGKLPSGLNNLLLGSGWAAKADFLLVINGRA